MVRRNDLKVLVRRISENWNLSEEDKAKEAEAIKKALYDLSAKQSEVTTKSLETMELENFISDARKRNRTVAKDSTFHINYEYESKLLDKKYEEFSVIVSKIADTMRILNLKFMSYGMKARFTYTVGGSLDEESVITQFNLLLNDLTYHNSQSLYKTLHYQNGRDYDDVERKQHERVIVKLFNEVA